MLHAKLITPMNIYKSEHNVMVVAIRQYSNPEVLDRNASGVSCKNTHLSLKQGHLSLGSMCSDHHVKYWRPDDLLNKGQVTIHIGY